MPEPEKMPPNQEQNGDLDHEKKSAYETNLGIGHTTNEVIREEKILEELRALAEERKVLKEQLKLEQKYESLKKEEKLLNELLAREKKRDSEAQPKTNTIEKTDTVAEASLPMGEKKKANFFEKVEKVVQSKSFKKVMANILAITGLSINAAIASAPDADSPAARSESMQMYSNANQVKSQNPMPDVILSAPGFTLYENSGSSAAESEQGIKNGYGEKGMWLSENKSGRFAFANAAEVAEVCDNDPKEMTYYTISNMPEAFASYISFTPDEYRREDFRGLSDAEIEKKIEGLSGPEYQDLLKHYRKNVLDASVFEDAILNGRYRTHYINYLGEGGANPTHENMGLFRCNVDRKHQKASAFRLPNGESILVNMSAIRDEQGEITGFRPEGCLQPQGVIAVSYNSKKDELQVISYDQSQGRYEVAIIPANIAETPIENQTEIPAIESIGPSGDSIKESIGPSGDDPAGEPKGPTGEPKGPTGEPKGPSGGHHGGSGTSTEQWGKEGDPHGGTEAYSDLVKPESEILKGENGKIDRGNQGYQNDGQATPGGPSEPNGVDTETGFAKITASDTSTSEGRLHNGDNQAVTITGEPKMAGENAYQSIMSTEQGQIVDDSGNNAGGNNYSDADEERAAMEGDL